VFIGRLTREKGLLPLLRAWPGDQRLDVIGGGPELDPAREIAGPGVWFVGPLDRAEVLARLADYVGLVFPGLCWEGAHPMVVREAMSRGTPVVAAAGSAAADVVQVHGCGEVYEPDDPASLAQALGRVRTSPNAAERALAVAVQAFSVERWQRDMDEVLATARGRSRKRPGR
jgi:glycosyltransferase involved in cell wall biosynthesis